ncbi:MAG: M67 family metallopeptidase [Solirubrobacteraceae bacterium]
MDISQELLEQILAHARELPEEECCGVVAVEPGAPAHAVRVFRAENVHASPLKFEIERKELLKLYNACQELGGLGAIYHSHVRSEPYPSQTDINFAAKWPGVEWIIVGLADPQNPEIRSYLIEEGVVREMEIGQVAV